jgi:hypothetical protein
MRMGVKTGAAALIAKVSALLVPDAVVTVMF